MQRAPTVPEHLKVLDDRIRGVKEQADMVEGRTEVLHEHITEVRDKYAHIDAVELRQNDMKVALGAQVRHLAEIDGHLNQIIRTQSDHGERLKVLDEMAVVQREHGERLKAVDERLNAVDERLKVLDDVVVVQREHGERLKAVDERLKVLDRVVVVQREHSERLDGLGGKVDLLLEHFGLTDGGSAN